MTEDNLHREFCLQKPLAQPILDHFPEAHDLAYTLCLEEGGGFGFQSDECGPPGYITFAKFRAHRTKSQPPVIWTISDAQKVCDDVARTSGSTTLKTTHFGYYFLDIHYSEYEKIPSVIQAALDSGCVITLHVPCGKLNAVFRPGDTFSWSEAERSVVEDFMRRVRYYTDRGTEDTEAWCIAYEACNHPNAWKKSWNWRTKLGQEFSRKLCQALDVPAPEFTGVYAELYRRMRPVCEKYHVLYGSAWNAYESGAEPQPVPPPSPMDTVETKETTDSKGNQCIICCYRQANTLVLPCMHSVVCKICSDKLKATPDATKCVACRRHITSVLSDQ